MHIFSNRGAARFLRGVLIALLSMGLLCAYAVPDKAVYAGDPRETVALESDACHIVYDLSPGSLRNPPASVDPNAFDNTYHPGDTVRLRYADAVDGAYGFSDWTLIDAGTGLGAGAAFGAGSSVPLDDIRDMADANGAITFKANYYPGSDASQYFYWILELRAGGAAIATLRLTYPTNNQADDAYSFFAPPGDIFAEYGYTVTSWAIPGGGTPQAGARFHFQDEGNGWGPGNSGITVIANIGANTDPIDYKVAYNGNGNSIGAPPVDNGTYNVGDPVAIQGEGDLARPGYVFSGWQYGGAVYQPGGPFAMPAGNVEFVAVWTPDPTGYKIGYVLNGGTNGKGNPDAYTAGQLPLRIADPARAGYAFSGWKVRYSNPAIPDIAGPVKPYAVPAGTTGDITLTAQWAANTIQYTVRYCLKGTSSRLRPDTVRTAKMDAAVSEKAIAIAGYTAVAPVSASIAIKAAASGNVITFYYTANAYTVAYLPNGGTGSMPDTPAVYNQNVTLGANAFSRAGYTFSGWNTAADGSGTAYAGGQAFNWRMTGNLTLYAMWNYSGAKPATATTAAKPSADPPAPQPAAAIPPAATPAAPPATPPITPPLDVPDVVAINDGDVPEVPPEPKPIKVNPTPIAEGSWALLNLVLTIATGIVMLLLLVTYFGMRREDGVEDGGSGEDVNMYLGLRLLSVAATIMAIILFVLTQNMRLPMGVIDHWTIWHVVIVAAAAVLAVFSRKRPEGGDGSAAAG